MNLARSEDEAELQEENLVKGMDNAESKQAIENERLAADHDDEDADEAEEAGDAEAAEAGEDSEAASDDAKQSGSTGRLHLAGLVDRFLRLRFAGCRNTGWLAWQGSKITSR